MIWLVVPAYDEAPNVPRLMAQLADSFTNLDFRVIVVDDGSSDGTADRMIEQAGSLDVRVLRHIENLGLGAAVRTGLLGALAVAGDEDLIVTIEADSTSDLASIEPMLECIANGADVVVASVHAPGGRMIAVPRWRVAASHATSRIFRSATGLRHVHTVTSLYRVYRTAVLRDAFEADVRGLVTETGFAVNLEILAKLARRGARIEEVPTTNDWRSRKGVSKMRTGATARAYARILVAQLRANSRS